MHVQIDLPEDIANSLIEDGSDLGRTASESLALEGYRSGRLSEEQLRRLLGFEPRLQVHGFLKDHQVYLDYSDQDLELDLKTARDFVAQWSSPILLP